MKNINFKLLDKRNKLKIKSSTMKVDLIISIKLFKVKEQNLKKSKKF